MVLPQRLTSFLINVWRWAILAGMPWDQSRANAHGDAVGNLIEDDRLGAVGRLRIDFNAAVESGRGA